MRSSAPVFIFVSSLAAFMGFLVHASGSSLERWLGNDGNRLPNIRVIEESCRPFLIERFIELQDWSNPTLLSLGDSQVFADTIDDTETFSAILAEHLGLSQVNISVLDGRPADTARIAKLLAERGISVRLAIMNLNQSHFSPSVIHTRHVPEVDAAPWDWIRCPYALRRLAIDQHLPLPSDGEHRAKFARLDLIAEYFAVDLPQAKAMLTPMLNAVAAVAQQSVAYVTPNDVEQFSNYAAPNSSIDISNYGSVSRGILSICEDTDVDSCFDASDALPDAAFTDIVHLGPGGHKMLAERLIDQFGLD